MTKMKTAFIAFSIALSTLASAKQFPLTWVKATEIEWSGVYCSLSYKKPPQLTDEPSAISKKPIYGVINLDGKVCPLRLDAPKGNLYSRILVDLNGNGDLSDDQAVDGKNMMEGQYVEGGQYQSLSFGPIAFERKGEPGIYMFADLYIYSLATNSRNSIGASFVIKSGWRLETEIDLEGTVEKIAFVDGDCNSRFDDFCEGVEYKSGTSTAWYLSAKDLVFRDGAPEPLGPYFYLAGKPYEIQFAEDFRSVSLEPCSAGLGSLRVSGADSIKSISVGWKKATDKEWTGLTPQPLDGKYLIPEGQCRLASCRLTGTDDGQEVQANGRLRVATEPLEITAESTARLKVGAPLDLVITVENNSGRITSADTEQDSGFLGALASVLSSAGSSSGSGTVQINVEITGAGGEQYYSFSRGNDQLKPPAFKIINEAEKVVASGQLEYG